MSNVEFCGQCPISDCPGHHPKPSLPNGCLFLWYGRIRLDKADVLFSFKINDRVFQESVQETQKEIALVLGLFKLVNRLRTEDTLPTCEHCGIGLTTQKSGCQDTLRCRQRKSFAQTVLHDSYLRFPEFKAQEKDVYLLARKSRVLEAYADSVHSNINQLLGLDAKSIKVFLTLNPVA